MLHIHTLSKLYIQPDSLSSIHVSLLGSALTGMHYSTQSPEVAFLPLRHSLCHMGMEGGGGLRGGELLKRGIKTEKESKGQMKRESKRNEKVMS